MWCFNTIRYTCTCLYVCVSSIILLFLNCVSLSKLLSSLLLDQLPKLITSHPFQITLTFNYNQQLVIQHYSHLLPGLPAIKRIDSFCHFNTFTANFQWSCYDSFPLGKIFLFVFKYNSISLATRNLENI